MSEALIGGNALRARLTALQGVNGASHTLVNRWQLETVRGAKILVPRKTGILGRSIHFLRGETGAGPTGVVYASAKYAAYVEMGTRPHEITPRAKKALRFASGAGVRLTGTPRTGAAVTFAKRVHHPGTQPHPFLKPAATAALGKIGMGQVIVDLWNNAA